MTKVFLTGMTSNQCNPDRTKNTFYGGTLALHSVLSRLAGITYNWGNPDQVNFNDYDYVFCGIYAPNSLGTIKRLPAVCENLLDVNPNNTKVYLHVDDWHTSSIRGGITAIIKDKNARRLFGLFHPGVDDATRNNMVRKAGLWASAVQEGKLNYDVLIPMLGWHLDRVGAIGSTLGMSNAKYIGYNYHAAFDPIDLPKVPKERGWVLATKYDYTDYVKSKKFEWPVIKYGCKKNGDNYLPNEEDVVREAFNRYWGLIVHPYPKQLIGQDRDKFFLANWTKSVVTCEPAEAGTLPSLNLSIADIEKMSDTDLTHLTMIQREQETKVSWTRWLLTSFVKRLIGI